MPNYCVTVTGTWNIDIEANSPKEAEEIATEKTYSGEINPVQDFDGNTFIEADEVENV